MSLVFSILGGVFTLIGGAFLAVGLSFSQETAVPGLVAGDLLVFQIVGGVFLAVGLMFLALLLRNRLRRAALVEGGQIVYATVTQAIENKSVNTGLHGHPYRFIAVEQGGQGRTFKSEMMNVRDPQARIGMQVRVFVDRYDGRYYVEIPRDNR